MRQSWTDSIFFFFGWKDDDFSACYVEILVPVAPKRTEGLRNEFDHSTICMLLIPRGSLLYRRQQMQIIFSKQKRAPSKNVLMYYARIARPAVHRSFFLFSPPDRLMWENEISRCDNDTPVDRATDACVSVAKKKVWTDCWQAWPWKVAWEYRGVARREFPEYFGRLYGQQSSTIFSVRQRSVSDANSTIDYRCVDGLVSMSCGTISNPHWISICGMRVCPTIRIDAKKPVVLSIS